ncbi:hypothetical protein L9G16_22720, partial [Shewanella sp. A25]|nr:hypothetical protein [Shewanella shenzhenensis]
RKHLVATEVLIMNIVVAPCATLNPRHHPSLYQACNQLLHQPLGDARVHGSWPHLSMPSSMCAPF